MKTLSLCLAALLALGVSAHAQYLPVPQIMNFQGRLTNANNTPLNGTYTLTFRLFDAATGGTQKWTQQFPNTTITNGVIRLLFTGLTTNVFEKDLWLEIQVDNNTPQTPRQQITTVAYAFKADTVPDGAIGTLQLANGSITAAKLAPNAITAAQLNPLAWLLGGNAGTNPATDFLGTTDNQPLELRVGSPVAGTTYRVMRYASLDDGTYRSINILGGSDSNIIHPIVIGATISGGGARHMTNNLLTLPNQVKAHFGTVGGGRGNQILHLGADGFVGGGFNNNVNASYGVTVGGYQNSTQQPYAALVGGFDNHVDGTASSIVGGQYNLADGSFHFVGGGRNNHTTGSDLVIAGGRNNSIVGISSVVGGGEDNIIQSSSATISGGRQNNITNAPNATISGGFSNNVAGDSATIPGGAYNIANGQYSFAAGHQAQAANKGTFVWADSTSIPFTSTIDDSFIVRASGGVGINKNNPATALDVNGTATMTGFIMPTGSFNNGVLTSNALGIGTWQSLNTLITSTNINWNQLIGTLTAWMLGGNTGTNPANNFVGTTDNQPLNFRVNNRRAMEYQYVENTMNTGFEFRTINVLGGSDINSIGAGVVGATIAGGGLDYFTFTDFPNRVLANFGTVGGGGSNTASGEFATVGGGEINTASGSRATAGGGSNNTASALYATVPGGFINIASGEFAVVGGGGSNTASGGFATVGGGSNNTASGIYAMVGGGFDNDAAGKFGFAAGQQAQANHIGAFVWNDASNTNANTPFASTGNNQFLVHATGGVGINKNNPSTTLDVAGTATMTGFILPTNIVNNGVLTSNGSGAGTWQSLSSLLTITGVNWNQIAQGTPTAWMLNGNTLSGSEYLGATNNQPVEIRTNNRRAMRYSFGTENPGGFNENTSINVLGGASINSIGASVVGATIAGGGQDFTSGTDRPNTINAGYGTIGGGIGNTIGGAGGTVAGGEGNQANGSYSFAAAGLNNIAAGFTSFAAGRSAQANHNGAFVWGDNNTTAFASTVINQFNIRASGGTRIFSNSTATTGVLLAAGGGSWSSVSDRNLKTNFQNVDTLTVLEKLIAMPLSTWNYKANMEIRHMGVMAQDFYAAFGGLGLDDKHIDTVDADGVAFAAIQGLNKKLEAKEKRLHKVEAENADLKVKLETLLQRIERLEAEKR